MKAWTTTHLNDNYVEIIQINELDLRGGKFNPLNNAEALFCTKGKGWQLTLVPCSFMAWRSCVTASRSAEAQL